MADTATLPGGGRGLLWWLIHHHNHSDGTQQLSGTEQTAAQQALFKLTGSSTAVTSTTTDKATAQGIGSGLKTIQGTSGLVMGHGNDTFAGGIANAGRPLAGFAADTVAGASLTRQIAANQGGHASFQLSSDTINVAGATAAGVKAQDPSHLSTSTHTVTLADKTTLNITGVDSHNIIKPHSH